MDKCGTWSRVAGLALGLLVGCMSKVPEKPAPPAKVVETPKPRPDDCGIPSDEEVRSAINQLRQRGSLARENEVADRHGLRRFTGLADLKAAVRDGYIIPVTETVAYRFGIGFAERDPENRELYKYALPHAKVFLDEFLGEAYRCFGADLAKAEDERLELIKKERDELIAALSSKKDKKSVAALAVLEPLDLSRMYDKFPIESFLRTEQYHKLLQHGHWAGQAASGADPSSRTVHTTGAVVDIGIGHVPHHVRAWLRVRLAKLENEGYVEVIQENARGAVCLHIMVLPQNTTSVR